MSGAVLVHSTKPDPLPGRLFCMETHRGLTDNNTTLKRLKAEACRITLGPGHRMLTVTITPYLSRDTTYCYRHCKGISRFPLLLHHPSPRPMPDRTTSTSLTFAYVITPY